MPLVGKKITHMESEARSSLFTNQLTSIVIEGEQVFIFTFEKKLFVPSPMGCSRNTFPPLGASLYPLK
ncbi:MAG: hypothetical protein DRJ11_00065 [Candidatus Aminicenantes bacterium]|nr:MAG: hypothetical protein DRJ11_00065 [Candidatus Aminicenantes bacterium]